MMWDTLCKYTSRVHSIAVTQSPRLVTIIEPLGSLMLSCPSASVSLFPNLHKLIWSGDGTSGAAEVLRMALVPSLLVLDVQISSASSTFLSVLSSAGALCPQLQDMALRIFPATDELFRKISPFVTQPISQLHNLRSLSVWDLGNQGIEHVMQLRPLRSLYLDIKTPLVCERKLRPEFPGFHDLNYLGLSTDTLKRASNFLSSFRVIESREIEIKVDFNHSAQLTTSGSPMLAQFFTILQERCDTDKLEVLTLLGISGKVCAEPDAFIPLQACRNLTRLSVERGCDVSMSDEELYQLVRDWPKLEVLKISCCSSFDDTTMPTLHGLIELLRLCPNLASLALVVDTTKLDGIDLKNPGGGNCNKHLKHLVLGDSPVGTPLKVALILSGLFPNLEQVNFECSDTAQTKKSILERRASVNSFLGGFSIVRERCIEA